MMSDTRTETRDHVETVAPQRRSTARRSLARIGRGAAWTVCVLTVLIGLTFFGEALPLGPAEDTVAVVAMLVPWMAIPLLCFAAIAIATVMTAWKARRFALLTAGAVAGVVAVLMVAVPFATASSFAKEHGGTVDFTGQLAGYETAAADETAVYAVIDGEELRVDVHLPERAEGPLPVMVYVHGGGWSEGTRDESSAAQGWLADQGFAVFSIDYRLAPQPDWQNAVGDVKCALGWVRDNAGTYGADADIVSIAGDSAGGHLAMMAAYTVGDAAFAPSCDVADAPVASVMTWFAPMDLAGLVDESDMPVYADEAVTGLLGDDAGRDAFEAASPISHVAAGLPPTMIVQGAADRLIPQEQGAAMADALDAAGVPVTLVDVPWAHHSFTGQWSGWAAQAMRPAVAEFLDEHAR